MVPESELPYNETLTGQANSNGESTLSRTDNPYAWRGNSVEYGAVVGEYANKAYNSLQSSKLPDSMKSLIRDYFSQLSE